MLVLSCFSWVGNGFLLQYCSLAVDHAYFSRILSMILLYLCHCCGCGGFDSWSLLFGRWFGQTLIVSISPNKTVEGVIGGLLWVGVFHCFLQCGNSRFIGCGYFIGCLLSDLYDAFKRFCQVKIFQI